MNELTNALRAFHSARVAHDDAEAAKSAAYKTMMAAGREVVRLASEAELARLPIVEGLPSYQVAEKTSVTGATQGNADAVRQWIRDLGFNPDDYATVPAATVKSLIIDAGKRRDKLAGMLTGDAALDVALMREMPPEPPECIKISTYKELVKRNS